MNNMEDERVLLSSLVSKLEEDEMVLATLQGMIAAEISMKRQELKLSQKEFAEKMSVSQSLVSRWENGDTNYTLQTLVKICSILELKMQSPIVPKIPKVYSVGNSRIYNFPCCSRWNSYESPKSSGEYKSVDNQDIKEM